MVPTIPGDSAHASPLDPQNRLGYIGELWDFIAFCIRQWGLSEVEKVSHIPEGYEDCNLRVMTKEGSFVFKLFADNQLGDYTKTRRGPDVADRLVSIMLAAASNGVHAPQLIRNREGEYLTKWDGLVALAYPWIEGRTYLDLNRIPTKYEVREILGQAALYHTVPLHPVYYHDIWAVPHFHQLYQKVMPTLSHEENEMIRKVRKRFDRINLSALPTCLVHGDFTKGNIICGSGGRPSLIDYSVTNWTHRILDLVIIITNFMFDEASSESLEQKVLDVVREYRYYGDLTHYEEDSLFDLCLAGSSMELMGSHWRQVYLNDTSSETVYWLELGRNGLRRELAI